MTTNCRKQRILIVDDEEMILDLEIELLEIQGYWVETNISSIDALESFLADPERFDLLISDLCMPEVNGVDLVRRIKSVRPQFSVLLMSGGSRIENDEALGASEGAKVLKKPFSLDELLESVHRVPGAPNTYNPLGSLRINREARNAIHLN